MRNAEVGQKCDPFVKDRNVLSDFSQTEGDLTKFPKLDESSKKLTIK